MTRTNQSWTVVTRWVFDAAWPQPTDNSQRVRAFDVLEVGRQLVQLHRRVPGLYALDGTSVAVFTVKQTEERIPYAFERIREEYPDRNILLSPNNIASHTREFARSRARESGIDLVFLPVGSPHLDPIESLWKPLKWSVSSISVTSTEGSVRSSETGFRS